MDYFDYYAKQYDSVYLNQVSEISKLSSETYLKLGSSYFEVMRQAGNENWKLTNRWSVLSTVGIGDLRSFYKGKYLVQFTRHPFFAHFMCSNTTIF